MGEKLATDFVSQSQVKGGGEANLAGLQGRTPRRLNSLGGALAGGWWKNAAGKSSS